jgi:hypothetical protein
MITYTYHSWFAITALTALKGLHECPDTVIEKKQLAVLIAGVDWCILRELGLTTLSILTACSSRQRSSLVIMHIPNCKPVICKNLAIPIYSVRIYSPD